MKKRAQDRPTPQDVTRSRRPKRPLTIEALEARIAPAMAVGKKAPIPPPYAPGTLYGLVRREHLRW